jgi:hypothetical protein
MVGRAIQLNKKRKEKGKHHEDAQTVENVAHATKHPEPNADSWLNSKVSEQSSQKNSRRRPLMSEKEQSGMYEGISRMAEKCFNPAGAKKAAAWYIDTTEKLATQALDFQVKATEWAKETPIYPLIEAQQTIGRKLVEQSVTTARSLWKL